MALISGELWSAEMLMASTTLIANFSKWTTHTQVGSKVPFFTIKPWSSAGSLIVQNDSQLKVTY